MANLISYSITEDTANGAVSPNKLHQEITDDGSVSGFSGLNTNGDSLEILGDSITDQPSLDALVAAHVYDANFGVATTIKDFIIGNYTDPYYINQPFNLFDFKNMLLRECATSKKTYKLANGRPQKAEYYIDGILVAVIYWTFTTTASNVVTNKKLELVYIRPDNSESDKILIKNKDFDPTDQSIDDGALVMKERVDARNNILEGIKANLAGIIMAGLGKTMAETVVVIRPFWDEYSSQRSDFIELGAENWRTEMAALDLGVTAHTWLGIELAPTYTVRDFIVEKLTY